MVYNDVSCGLSQCPQGQYNHSYIILITCQACVVKLYAQTDSHFTLTLLWFWDRMLSIKHWKVKTGVLSKSSYLWDVSLFEAFIYIFLPISSHAKKGTIVGGDSCKKKKNFREAELSQIINKLPS